MKCKCVAFFKSRKKKNIFDLNINLNETDIYQ